MSFDVRHHYALNTNNPMGWIADLLKEIPSAARYKSELEQLAFEHEALKTKNVELETKNAVLASKLEAAQREIQRLALPANQKRHADRTEIQQRILVTISSNKNITTPQVSKRLQIGPNIAEQQLERLSDAGMIWTEPANYGAPHSWELMPPGRDYLIERGLLK